MTSSPTAAVWSDLQARLESAGIRWQDSWLAPLQQLADLLAAGQAQTNLVGDPSPTGLCGHVLEAMVVAHLAQQALGRAPALACDVGAGAGLQGLAWALFWPTATIVLVEPRKKRAEFIADTAARMGLRQVQVVQRSLSVAGLAGRCDFASARAVWPVPEWLDHARALCLPGGVIGLHVRGPLDVWQQQLARLQYDHKTMRHWQFALSAQVPGPQQNVVVIARPA